MSNTILITGTSTGIGRATALYFAQKGWNVAATMRTPSKETELQKNNNIKLYALDVTDISSIQQAIQDAIRDFGKIDAIVNNAGYGAVGIFEASTPEQVEKQFDTNVFGLMNVVREILPHFRERKSSTIINVSSMGGIITFPTYSVYHATKWAVEGFSESLQFELRPFNIRVKLIEPGAIRTDFYVRSAEIFKKEGLTAYDDYFNQVHKNIAVAEANSPAPDVVAAKIYQAATDGSRWLRYPASFQAKMLLVLRKFLPTRLFRWIVKGQVEKGFKG